MHKEDVCLAYELSIGKKLFGLVFVPYHCFSLKNCIFWLSKCTRIIGWMRMKKCVWKELCVNMQWFILFDTQQNHTYFINLDIFRYSFSDTFSSKFWYFFTFVWSKTFLCQYSHDLYWIWKFLQIYFKTSSRKNHVSTRFISANRHCT